MSDSIGWVIIGGVILSYLQDGNKPKTPVTTFRSPSAELEIDPTRWSHTGVQPLFYKKGNGATFPENVASDLFDKLE